MSEYLKAHEHVKVLEVFLDNLLNMNMVTDKAQTYLDDAIAFIEKAIDEEHKHIRYIESEGGEAEMRRTAALEDRADAERDYFG